MAESDMSATESNEEGDKEFNRRNWSEAISHYTKAIELAADDTEKESYYDNRAATYFELRNYDKSIEDCDSALKIFHNSPTTLIRKFLALIELERFEDAYQIIISFRSNDISQHTAKQCRKIPHRYIKEKVSQMAELAFNVSTDKEKRKNATITLLILAHWRTAYEIFIKKVGEYDEVICNAIRIVGKSCDNNVSQPKSSMINVVLPWYMEMINSTCMESVNVSEYYLQDVLNAYSGMNDEADSKSVEALCKGHEEEINTFLSNLLDKIRNETTTGVARDTLINFITHNIHYTAVDWAKRLSEIRGLQKLMTVASKMVKFKNKISIDITSSTQALISMYLTEMYEEMIRNDDDKKTFINAIDEFIGDKLPKLDTEFKVRIILAITTLIFSPLDVAKVESIVADVLPWCLEMINSTCTERVNASQYCLQIILNTFSGMNDEPDSKPDNDLCKMHKKVIDEILSCLLDKIKSNTTTGIARDALIEFITRNIHYTALDWVKQLIEFDGLETLMEVASQCRSEYCKSLDITSFTQTITGLCLAKIEENLNENDKKDFFNIIDEFIREEFNSTDVGCHVNAIVAMITLTLGPFNVANTIITKDAFYMIIVDFWNKNDLLLRKVICEFIYVIVNKYDKFIRFIRESLPILEKLFNAEVSSVIDNLADFEIWRSFKSMQIRAFVNICKMSKFEELKYFQSVHMFDDGTLMQEVPPIYAWFLINRRDMKKWAVASLSYLTFNIEVKKELMENREIVKAIIEFAQTENQSILYQVDILLVNLCSAYDKEDLIPEMETFVNYFGVKNQILAKDDYVRTRRRVLAEAGVTSALVSLAKIDSPNSKELIARVFNAICSEEELREIVVKEGGTETLLSLALDGTDKGKKYASRALMHLALTMDPKVAFPGQLIMNVVQPIVDLLSSECSVDERYEAVTALHNLASTDDTMRLHIFMTKYEKIEHCIHDKNNLLKRTSIQLTNNLVSCCKIAFQLVEQRSDQLHNLIMWNMVEDNTNYYIIHAKEATARMFVTLTATSEEACVKLLSLPIWLRFVRFLLYNRNDDLQHKGTEIMLNMMESTKDVAEKLIKMYIIMRQVRALSNNDAMPNKETKKLASLVLEAAAQWDIIEGNVEGNEPLDSSDNTEIRLKRLNVNN